MDKERERALLRELAKDCRQSDRELAKKIRTSQPTVTRARKTLEEKYIQRYSIIPKLEKLGVEMVAVTLLKTTTVGRPAYFIGRMNDKRIIFASYGMGLRKNLVIISAHTSYSDYSDFMQKIQEQPELSDAESFITCPTTKDIIEHLSFSSII